MRVLGIRHLRRRYGRPPRRPVGARPSQAQDVTLWAENGAAIRGWWFAASHPDVRVPGPGALILHGWGSSAEDMLPVVAPLRTAGLHVLVLDARGHGRSDDADFTSMPAFADDLAVGLRWLCARPEVDATRIVLVGHSVGAGASLLVASREPSVAAVICVASMAHPRAFMSRLLRNRLPGSLLPLALRAVEHAIGHRFDTFAPVHTISRLGVPVLLVHGASDTTVSVADAHELYAHAPAGSALLVVPGAQHDTVEMLDVVMPAVHDFLCSTGVLFGGDSSSGRPEPTE